MTEKSTSPTKKGNGKSDHSQPLQIAGSEASKLTREEWQERQKKRQQIKIGFAERPDTSVVWSATPDTHAMVQLVSEADKLLNALRMKIDTPDRDGKVTITYEVFKDLMDRYKGIKLGLHDLNKDLARTLGRQYRPPREIKSLTQESAPASAVKS